ncbi:MAG: alpha/beta hydrolase family protein [Croceibacterium sp.]
MRRLRLVAVLLLATWPASTFGQSNLPFEFQPMHAPAPDLGLKAPIAYPKPLRYGDKAWQSMDFYPAKSAGPTPLVIAFFSAAKGWDRYRFNQAGIAIAFVPDRETVPTARKTVDNYLAAIATLYNNAEQLGIDRSRFVLYGSGGGGSMAVLLGTDPTLLGRAGVPFEAVRGVVSVGGEDFDVVRRSSKNAFLRSRYLRYYGSDEAETASLSPATHLAAPNAPGFLLLARERDTDAFEESGLIAQALMKAGSPATFMTLPEQREGVRRTYLLVEQGGAGWEIMDFVQEALGAPR